MEYVCGKSDMSQTVQHSTDFILHLHERLYGPTCKGVSCIIFVDVQITQDGQKVVVGAPSGWRGVRVSVHLEM